MNPQNIANLLLMFFLLDGFFIPSLFTQSISFNPNSGQRGTSFSVTVSGPISSPSTNCVRIFSSPDSLQLIPMSIGPGQLTGTLTIPLTINVGTYDARMYEGPDCIGTQYNCIDCFTIIDTSCLTALVVTTTGSSGTGSLRVAFGCASSGDTIRFDQTLSNTTITLNLPDISNTKELVLSGNLTDNITISSVQLIGNNQPFISSSGSLSISGLKLRGNGSESLIFKVDSGGDIEFVDCDLNSVTIDKN